MNRPRDTQEQTRRALGAELKRLAEQEGKITGGAGLPDDAPQAQGEPDAVEIWAKRTGRALGYLFALYLLWHLFSTYVLPR